MVLKGEHPQGEDEQLTPPGILAREELEDDRHESANILDINSLRVEVGKDRGFMEKQAVVEQGWRGRWGGARTWPRPARQPRARAPQRRASPQRPHFPFGGGRGVLDSRMLGNELALRERSGGNGVN